MLAALVLGWSGSALAEKKRVAVPRFDGPQEAIVRRAVMQVLRGEYDVVGAKEIDAAAKSTGAQLDSNDGFKAVAKELAISSFVTGEVSKKKAKLTVRNGADGSVSGEGSFGGPNPKKVAGDVRDGFTRRLGSAVERGRAPAGAKKPTAAPVAEAADEPDDKDAAGGGDEEPARKPAAASAKAEGKSDDKTEGEATPPSGDAAPEETVAKKAPAEAEGEGPATGPRALDVSLGLGGFNRSLSYNQDLYGTLRQYSLALGPEITLKFLIFPAAFGTAGFIANLGLELNVEQAFAVTSSVPANPMGTFPMGATFNTLIHDYYGGARVRLVLSGGHELALTVGGGEHAFAFRDGPGATDDRTQLNIPDTIYRYVRVGVDTRFELPGGVTLGASGAYRVVLNQGGQIADPGFFPFLTVGGVDFSATLGYHITSSIEGRLSANLRRYFYNMHSDPTDLMANPPNSVAGGAIDQYIGFSVGAAYIFGGVARGATSGEEEPEAASAPKKKKKKKKKGGDDEDGGDAGGDDNGGGGGSSDE